jgi:hypothetical protein
MKAKLIKENDFYYLLDGNKIIAEINGHPLKSITGKLSKQNCDEIFGVVDVEELANETWKDLGVFTENDKHLWFGGFRNGFNKAIELNKDKVFTLEDVRKAFNKGYLMKFNPSDEYTETLTGLVQSLQQPTEIEVEIVMERYPGLSLCAASPEKDSEGCLILKKI